MVSLVAVFDVVFRRASAQFALPKQTFSSLCVLKNNIKVILLRTPTISFLISSSSTVFNIFLSRTRPEKKRNKKKSSERRKILSWKFLIKLFSISTLHSFHCLFFTLAFGFSQQKWIKGSRSIDEDGVCNDGCLWIM